MGAQASTEETDAGEAPTSSTSGTAGQTSSGSSSRPQQGGAFSALLSTTKDDALATPPGGTRRKMSPRPDNAPSNKDRSQRGAFANAEEKPTFANGDFDTETFLVSYEEKVLNLKPKQKREQNDKAVIGNGAATPTVHRKDGRPKPKTASRKTIGLRPWEEASDSDNEKQAEKDGGGESAGWTPFHGDQAANVQVLMPFEEQDNTLALQEPDQAVSIDFAEDEDAARKTAREQAARDGHLVQIPPAGQAWGVWQHNRGASGTYVGGREGDLNGLTCKPAVATFQDPQYEFHDFDMEAELMLTGGEMCGLVFRSNGFGNYYVFLINKAKRRQEGPKAELWHFHCSDGDPMQCTKISENCRNIKFESDTWQRLRVRATADTILLFFNGEQISQFDEEALRNDHAPGSRDERAKPAKAQRSTMNASLEASQTLVRRSGKPHGGCGFVGVWALLSRAQIRDISVIDLSDAMDEVSARGKMLKEEINEIRRVNLETMAHSMRATRASKLIQEVGKYKVKFIQQRMKLYSQATEQGRDTKLRERTILTWVALLSVFYKLSETLHSKEIVEQKTKKFLKALPPPPPPPPPQDPPQGGDEDLHYKYQEMRNKYCKKWERAGRREYGDEEFRQKMKEARYDAEKVKKDLTKKCLMKSMEVMSEREHQEEMKKAWTLENDWTSTDEFGSSEMQKWAIDKMKAFQDAEEKSRDRRASVVSSRPSVN